MKTAARQETLRCINALEETCKATGGVFSWVRRARASRYIWLARLELLTAIDQEKREAVHWALHREASRREAQMNKNQK